MTVRAMENAVHHIKTQAQMGFNMDTEDAFKESLMPRIKGDQGAAMLAARTMSSGNSRSSPGPDSPPTAHALDWGQPRPFDAFIVDVSEQPPPVNNQQVDLNDFVVASGPEGASHFTEHEGFSGGAYLHGIRTDGIEKPGTGSGHKKRVRWTGLPPVEESGGQSLTASSSVFPGGEVPAVCSCAPEYREPCGLKSKITVGGRERNIGGWCRYELDCRESGWRYSGRRPASNYPGRSYIGAADVIESVGGAGRGADALRQAAKAVALSLGRLEDLLCDPSSEGLWECLPPSVLSANPARRGAAKSAALLTIPRVTSADAADFAKTGLQDPEAIAGIVEDVESVTASLGPRESNMAAVPPPLPALLNKTDKTGAVFALNWRPPPIGSRFVEVGDDEGVLRLEGATAPYLDALEELQAAAASRLEQAAKTIRDAIDARARGLGLS